MRCVRGVSPECIQVLVGHSAVSFCRKDLGVETAVAARDAVDFQGLVSGASPSAGVGLPRASMNHLQQCT